MNTKSVIISAIVLTIGVGALYVWLNRKGKKEEKKAEEDDKPRTPEMLLKRLIERLLEENAWKNERDFLSSLSKQYIKEAVDISWIDYLPVSQEGMYETLNEVGLLTEFENKLEKKYQRSL